MKRYFKTLIVILLTYVIPYTIMYFNNTLTQRSYGNAMCYIGLIHMILALFSLNSGVAVGDRILKGYLYSNNLFSDLSKPQQSGRVKSLSSISVAVWFLLGVATVYAGYLLAL